MTAQEAAAFRRQVRDYYVAHGRHDLPWRLPEADGSFDPYKILISEVMLQQTQVARVIPKYRAFLDEFPTLQALAAAPLGAVLRAWNGLGYNRRAKFLQHAAQALVNEQGAMFPRDMPTLVALPGIGVNTAGAILAYSFDQPVVFIETNIRSVFIHHFFKGAAGVPDAAILQLVARTLPPFPGPAGQYREWYWALMDYGTYLKQTAGNASRLSKSYVRQAAFAGSKRQLRGQIIRLLADKARSGEELREAITDPRLSLVLQELEGEGLVRRQGKQFVL